MSAQQKPDGTVLGYIGRVKDPNAKAYPKLADSNRQQLAVSLFGQGERDQEFDMITANTAQDDGASALRFATSAAAFLKRITTDSDTNRVVFPIRRMLLSTIRKGTVLTMEMKATPMPIRKSRTRRLFMLAARNLSRPWMCENRAR